MSYRVDCDEQERKLFVGGLDKSNTDEDVLKNYFEPYGGIIDCSIIRDRDRVSRGFGFILFDNTAALDKIMSAKKDGAEFIINDHHLELKRALPKVYEGDAPGTRITGLNRKIFVGGLPSSITEQILREYFESYGRVNEVELLRDKGNGQVRGFAFVTFDEEDCAQKCMQRRQHEICKKICEVKSAQARSKLDDKEKNGRRSGLDDGGRKQQNNQLPSGVGGGMSIAEANQLIQRAYIMGQQSVQGTQLPTVSSLLNGVIAPTPVANNNILLQALMNQPTAPAPAPAPVAPLNNNTQAAQLAQLLQSNGITASSLAGIIKDNGSAAPVPAANRPVTKYPVAYPSVPSYDYGYANIQSSYGPIKEDNKRGYRPY